MAQRIMEIRISPAVEFKLRSKHGLTGDEVRSALIYPAHTQKSWDYSNLHNLRLRVIGKTETNRNLVAYLYPVSPRLGIWNLATSWYIRGN